MPNTGHPSRRKAFTAGTTSLAATSLKTNPLLAGWKAPGETWGIYQGGDFHHNQCTQEVMWGRVLSPVDWRLISAQDIAFVTPKVLDKKDLFILCRYADEAQSNTIAPGWTQERFVEKRTDPTYFMSDEFENVNV